MSFVYTESKEISKEQLLKLYNSVGWSAYTNNIDSLSKAIQGSSYVCSVWNKDALIALIRCISDDASIMYVQDVLVDPKYQKKGELMLVNSLNFVNLAMMVTTSIKILLVKKTIL